MYQTDKSGEPSRVFGERFPYPIDGKSLMVEFCTGFAQEFNQRAKKYLIEQYGEGRVPSFPELTVTSAFPTTRQQCPRLCVQRRNSTPANSGVGNEIDVRQDETGQFRHYRGYQVVDDISVSLCTLNEWLRDDLSLWFTQYMLDAIFWAVPRLGGVFNVQPTSISDDVVEYQGGGGQPGFQFYTANLAYKVGYDLIVCSNVDELEGILNWQQISEDWWLVQEVTLFPNQAPEY